MYAVQDEEFQNTTFNLYLVYKRLIIRRLSMSNSGIFVAVPHSIRDAPTKDDCLLVSEFSGRIVKLKDAFNVFALYNKSGQFSAIEYHTYDIDSITIIPGEIHNSYHAGSNYEIGTEKKPVFVCNGDQQYAYNYDDATISILPNPLNFPPRNCTIQINTELVKQ